jgi:ATP-dependent DNA helicase DinG
MPTVAEFFKPKTGLIARVKPDFQEREGQSQLTSLILDAIEEEKHVIAEAPTGFGKSFAVLTAAMIAAAEGKRVVISTETLTLQDQYCIAPDTRVLTEDLRYIPAEDVEVGMALVGFDEEVQEGAKRRRFRTTHVTSVSKLMRPSYRLIFASGLTVIASADHRWLCGRGNGRPHWVTTEAIYPEAGKRPGSKVVRFFETWDEDTSHTGGYLAAAFDGEGHLAQHKSATGESVSNALIFTQKRNPMLAHIKECLLERGYRFTNDINRTDCKQLRISPRAEMVRFLGSIRPHRLLPKYSSDKLGTALAAQHDRVVSKEFIGEHEVVSISTTTKTLIVEGLASHNCNHDLPLMCEAAALAGMKVTYAVAKGRNNLVCRIKVDDIEGDWKDDREIATEAHQTGQSSALIKLKRWAAQQIPPDSSGDRAQVPFDHSNASWNAVSCNNDCLKSACAYYDQTTEGECFICRARATYLEAKIVVVNHTLLLLDSATGGKILGGYDLLIIDEAHTLPKVAQQTWGVTLKERTLSSVVGQADRILKQKNINILGQEYQRFRKMEDDLFRPLRPLINKGNSVAMGAVHPGTYKQFEENAKAAIGELKDLRRTINEEKIKDPRTVIEKALNTVIQKAKDQLSKLTGEMSQIIGQFDEEAEPDKNADNWLTYLESSTDSRGHNHGALHLKPIEPAPLISGRLLNNGVTVVFLSATLRTGKTFGFFRREIGMAEDRCLEFVGTTPFDFKTQCVGYFPTSLPLPDSPNYVTKMSEAITELIETMEGRTMVLFTSTKLMREVHEIVSKKVVYNCLLQGSTGKGMLIEHMKRDTHSCLFATKSFFTGVDIPGDALSCVILTKAPFEVPSEPMFQARCNKIKARGDSDFKTLALPLMLFDLLQAFGRLIRTSNDFGVFALLDSRANKAQYGEAIRRALPGMKIVRRISQGT